MSYQVTTEQRPNRQGLDGTVHVLQNAAGTQRAEVWPALGFNCFRWRTEVKGTPAEVLYADPQLFEDGRPTRSGIPVLFPFPNRIREGRFRWEGRVYQLPLDDPAKKNGIHGFACRKPWRVVGAGADATGAWVAGEFQASVDAPEFRRMWPADYLLRLMIRLTAGRLQLAASVVNPDKVGLPFGLGYHPYFQVPLVAGAAEADVRVEAPARSQWELRDSLPTGKRSAPDAAHDLTQGKPLAGLNLDDLYGDLPAGADALVPRGSVRTKGVEVRLWAAPDFRDLVVFTPPHRKAVCLEPYTCITDAINLQPRGIDAGWRVLAPGQEWLGVVEVECRGV